jgi:Tfp pilus assembly protein PilF
MMGLLDRAGDCLRRGDLGGAEAACRALLGHDGRVPGAWFALGVVRQLQARLDESVACYRQSLALSPMNSEAWNNLGASLNGLRRPEEAEHCLLSALRIEPRYAEAHNNLGNALQAQGRYDEALRAYARALECDPNYLQVFDHIGLLMMAQGRLDEAVACFTHLLERRPDDASVHVNRAFAWLQMGHHARGWEEYEWRLKCREHARSVLPMPRWDGSPLEGRTILLLGEQGLGDVIQFIRYAPLVAARGGRVVVSCPPSLAGLVSSCPGVSEVVAEADGGPVPRADCYVPLMSLPHRLGSRVETIPAGAPYLAAEPARLARWRAELAGAPGRIRVGIVWQGNPDHKKDRQRSFRLEQAAPLAEVPGIHLFSLQKGHGAGQLDEAAGRLPITSLGPRLHDFGETAAVVKCLDLVIAPDTSVIHLAGALGVPGWLALAHAADWRWMSEREDTPWYPSLRLFRQRRPGDWAEVFTRMARALAAIRGAG